jgi:hypothetical protein
MPTKVQADRIPGGFILMTGIAGTRYALRHHAALIHDPDECRHETMVQLHCVHVLGVPCSLDEVLAWFG